MLKNRAFQVQMVRTGNEDPHNTPTETRSMDPELISQLVQDHVYQTTVVVGTAVIATKVLSTLCEIAIIAAKAKFH